MRQYEAMNPYTTIFFDLDGTLTDPAEGITRSIQYALARLGCHVPPAAGLRAWIGPPLRQSFAHYLGTDDQALVEQAMIFYRERFANVGLFENVVYAGVPELLADLRAAGYRLYLATSKPLPYAERILAHFSLAHHFTLIGGATLDGRLSEKAQIIGELLRADDFSGTRCIMVGDREHDVLGARAHGLPCVAVTYGYGSLAELEACRPTYLVGSVGALRATLLRET